MRHLLISIQWKEMGARAAQAGFKCRLVKLGAERIYHQKGSPGVSHTCHHLLSKWNLSKGVLPVSHGETQNHRVKLYGLCHTGVRQAAPSGFTMHQSTSLS